VDVFLSIKNTKFFIHGRCLQKERKDYPKDSKIQLCDNFVAYMFDSIEVKKHGKVLDEIDYVERVSSVEGVLSYSINQNGPTINSGFVSNFQGEGRFNVMDNISQLGLGWFKDQTYPVFKGDMEINFTRNDALIKQVIAGTEDLKIIIDELTLRIPIIEYNAMHKVLLLNKLTRFSQEKSVLLILNRGNVLNIEI